MVVGRGRVVGAGLGFAVTLGVGLTGGIARADLPPPEGMKFVSYEVRVEGLEAHPDHVLLVYPWSLSNGAPTREVGVLTAGQPLPFGRRFGGRPRVYAMRKDAWESVRAEIESRDPEGMSGNEEGFPAEGAVDCGTEISPRHQVDEGGPEVATDTYQVTTLSDEACQLKKLSSTPIPTARGGCASCSVQDASDDRPWWLIGLLALGLRRRMAER